MHKTLFFLFWAMLIVRFADGQNAQLDPGFSHNGFLISDFGIGPDEATSIAAQPDGKVLVAGTAWNSSPDFVVARYRTDGSLDPTFGSGGRSFIDGSGDDNLVSVHALPDGKILLVGSSQVSSYNQEYARFLSIVRCLPDGTLDTTFGIQKGRTLISQPYSNCFVNSALVQPDGKILVLCNDNYSYSVNSMTLFRFTPEGLSDTTFGDGGKVPLFLGEWILPRGMALQAGGKIVVAAASGPFGGGDIYLTQFEPNGLIDNSFGTDGFATANLIEPNDSFPFPSIDYPTSVLVAPDSTIVVVGHTYHGNNIQHMMAARFTSAGTLKNYTLGLAYGIIGGNWFAPANQEGLAAALQPDGKIVAAGFVKTKVSDNLQHADFFVVRFNSDEGVDPDFGDSGRRIIALTTKYADDKALDVAVLPDGKIMAAGRTKEQIHTGFAVVQLNPDGSTDSTFANTGIALDPIGTNTDRGTDVAFQEDGKILVGAVVNQVKPFVLPQKTASNTNSTFFDIFQNVPIFEVARYQTDGALDSSFGENGRIGFSANTYEEIYYDYSPIYSLPHSPVKTAIAQRANGNILVAGSRDLDFGIAEFYPDGTQDTFLISGPGSQIIRPFVRKIDFGYYGADVATAIVVDEVFTPIPPYLGYTVAGHTNGRVAVAWCCFSPSLGDGTRKGVFSLGIGPSSLEYATAVGYQIDESANKVYTVVGGYYIGDSYFGDPPRMFLMRLENDDSHSYWRDQTFGDYGVVYGNIGVETDRINAFSIQSDNSIIAAGAVDNQMAVFKFLPDGAFDHSFGNVGVVILSEGVEANDVLIQPNGKIAVTGSSADKVVTARLLSNGQRDPDFGINGVLVTDLRGKKDQGLAIGRQGDGKLVVAGASDDPFAGTDFALLRYKPNTGVPPLEVSATIQAVNCPGGDDGQLTVSASGGVPPYTFLWNTGTTGATLNGLAAGTYTVTATDSEGQQQVIPLTVSEPAELEAGITIETEVTCNDLPGTATATPGGGTPPFDLQWSSGETGPNATLPPGIFTITLTDAHGCTAIFEGAMTVVPDTIAPTITCPAAITTQACTDPVNYPLPVAADNCTILGLNLVAGLPPGSVFPEGITLVRYDVADEAGNTAACVFEVSVQNTLVLTAEAEPACSGELNTLTALASGGTAPYLFAWSNGATDATILAPSGLYSVTLTDALGCTRTSIAFVQEYPPIFVVATVTPAWINTSNGIIQAAASGGEPPFGYTWLQNGQPVGADSVLTNIPAGLYTLVVTDAVGCTNESVWTVSEIVATSEPENVLRCQVFPNPFAQTVLLQVALRRSAEIRWTVTDLAGRILEQQNAGNTAFLQTEWNSSNLAPGIYLLQVWVNGDVLQRKLVKI